MKKTFCLLSILLPLLFGCTPATSLPPTVEIPVPSPTFSQPTFQPTLVPSATLAPSPTRQPTASRTPKPSPTRTRRPTFTPAPSSTPTSSPTASLIPQLGFQEELPADTLEHASDLLHNLIIFTNGEGSPFPYPYEGANGLWGLSRYCPFAQNCLWAISPDGKRGGMISPEGYSFSLFIPPYGNPKFVENGFQIDSPAIEGVALPDVCSPGSTKDFLPCDQINFSPNGRYLSFRYGPDTCGRNLMLMDRYTGETILDTGSVHRNSYLPNGKLEINSGSCEGSRACFFDPSTRETVDGDSVMGPRIWNLDQSFFIESPSPYHGFDIDLWGYRLDTNTVFYPNPEEKSRTTISEQITFLPDGQSFIYQYISVREEERDYRYLFDTPSQIFRYDPRTGERSLLTPDGSAHYFIKPYGSNNIPLSVWDGNWIQIQRIPFEPMEMVWESWNYDSTKFPPCLFWSQDCTIQPELLALNAVTGVTKPWDEAALPTPIPSPTPGPDLQTTSIYTDPAGKYAFYLGQDGKSLWLVPTDGDPVLWVTKGSSFIYLP